MLVLSRKAGEKVVIGDGITLTVIEVKANRVRVGIDAPGQVRILRGELVGQADLPVTDPDLAEKPPEWRDVSPDLVIFRQ
jgi:carbon storage regulator